MIGIRYALALVAEHLTICPVCNGSGGRGEWASDPADWCGYCHGDGEVSVRRRYEWLWFIEHNRLTPNDWLSYWWQRLSERGLT